MAILKYKTNLKCGGCVSAITPSMNALKGVISWKVDIKPGDSILEVETVGEIQSEIKAIVEKAGYKIELMNTL